MREMRVGIDGFGVMGLHHGVALSESQGMKLIAVADPDADALKKAINRFGCQTYKSLYAMLSGAALDMVVVATHAPLHHAHACRALEHGCHVVCEKPMACTLAECDDMVAIAASMNRVLAIHHQSVFSRAAEKMRHMILTGYIGNVYLYRCVGKGRRADSDLMEIAGHLLHMARYLARENPIEVYGDMLENGDSVTYDDVAEIQSRYPQGRKSGVGAGTDMMGWYKCASGARIQLLLNKIEEMPATFGEERQMGYYVEALGAKGRLELYLPRVLFHNASALGDLSKNATPSVKVDKEFCEDRDPVLTKLFYQDLLHAIASDSEPKINGNDGRDVMEMCFGLVNAHFAGRPIRLPCVKRTNAYRP